MELIDIIYYAICGVFLVASLIIAVCQRAREKNISKLQALYECIPNAVITAESIFGSGNGEKKKHLVMTELMNIALQSKTKFDYNELDKRVENVVKATKNVNVTVESVAETFCKEQPKEQSNEQSICSDEEQHELVKTDGAVVVEIDKIGA